MIYTITDEQHFQVLSDSFSVSPSETGYELYFSANGVEFSPFTTVAAGQNKQFVNMANGNYYYLSGNVGDVEVNWEKDCGGGGGGGTAGVSSLDGQTGALTTKTINGNAILGTGDIVISGGGGDSNYVIVDALSAITNPVEGMIAYIPAHSETFTGLSIESSQVAYQAQLKKSAPRDIAYTVSAAYSIGTDNNASSSFYFDSGNWTPMYRKNVWLQYDDANQKTKIVCRDGYTIECFLSQEYYEAITTSFTVDEQVFIYKNNKWYPFEDGKISFYLNNVNTQAKWTDFINEINRLAPGSFQYVYDWFNFDWSTIKFNTLSRPQYSDGITLAYGTSYLFKSSNGETFDILNAYSLRIDNSAGWKNIALATQAGVPIASDSTLGGIKVGSGLTIDANGVLSADGGGGDSKTIVNIDALSQSELVDLYNTLSGATSVDEVNKKYEFYANFVSGNHYYRLQFCAPYDGDKICFGAVLPSASHTDYLNIYECNVDNNGNISKSENMYQQAELNRWGRTISFYVSEDASGTLTIPYEYNIFRTISEAIGNVAWYGRSGYYNGADFLSHFNVLVVSEVDNVVIAISPVNIYAANGTEISGNNFGAVFDYTDKSGDSWRVKFTWGDTSATVVSKTAI